MAIVVFPTSSIPLRNTSELHCLPAVGICRTHRGGIELGQGIPIPGQKSSMSPERLETKDTLEEKAHKKDRMETTSMTKYCVQMYIWIVESMSVLNMQCLYHMHSHSKTVQAVLFLLIYMCSYIHVYMSSQQQHIVLHSTIKISHGTTLDKITRHLSINRSISNDVPLAPPDGLLLAGDAPQSQVHVLMWLYNDIEVTSETAI